jgi:hypothetical protein
MPAKSGHIADRGAQYGVTESVEFRMVADHHRPSRRHRLEDGEGHIGLAVEMQGGEQKHISRTYQRGEIVHSTVEHRVYDAVAGSESPEAIVLRSLVLADAWSHGEDHPQALTQVLGLGYSPHGLSSAPARIVMPCEQHGGDLVPGATDGWPAIEFHTWGDDGYLPEACCMQALGADLRQRNRASERSGTREHL